MSRSTDASSPESHDLVDRIETFRPVRDQQDRAAIGRPKIRTAAPVTTVDRQRRSEHVADVPLVRRPVHAELELLDQARDHAD